MNKICTRCGQERDAENDFSWKVKGRGIRQAHCKFCQAQVSRKHYEKYKQAYVSRARSRGSVVIAENRKKLIDYLADHPCIDCGQADARVLDFDHVRGEKSEHIVRLVNVGYSWSAIEVEIAKCEVRCANCHRLRTGENINSWRHFSKPSADTNPDGLFERSATRYAEHKRWLYAYLLRHPCVDCGFADIRCLEFDHVRGEKLAPITRLISRPTPLEALEAEIAKCEVRCANCHRLKTLERGGWWRSLLR